VSNLAEDIHHVTQLSKSWSLQQQGMVDSPPPPPQSCTPRQYYLNHLKVTQLVVCSEKEAVNGQWEGRREGSHGKGKVQ